jgi:quercetin dioxygenase-like cupin family protein
MKNHRTHVVAATGVAAVAALVATALIVVPALATPQSGVSTTQLAKGVFDEIDVKTDNFRPHKVKIRTKELSDVHVVRNTFAPRTETSPGGQSGWHTHPGPSLITVTLGEITAYDGDDPTCTPKVYKAGEGFVDPGDGHVHLLRNETTAPAETVAVQILPKGAERRIDAPKPVNCPC